MIEMHTKTDTSCWYQWSNAAILAGSRKGIPKLALHLQRRRHHAR